MTPVSAPAALGRRAILAWTLLLLGAAALVESAAQLRLRILILQIDPAVDTSSSTDAAVNVLSGYGMPYDIVTVPQAGYTGSFASLLEQNSVGQYSGIIVSASQLIYNYSGSYLSALNATQWAEINAYQAKYGVRSVNFLTYPSAAAGTAALNPSNPGCCATGTTSGVRLTQTSVSSALNTGILPTISLDMPGLWYYPTVITNTTSTQGFLAFTASTTTQFTSSSYAATITTYDDGHQEMNLHFGVASWSATSLVVNHLYFAWLTRGIYQGERRLYLNIQVDDFYLSTQGFDPATNTVPDNGTPYRVNMNDLNEIVSWQNEVATKILPTGSTFRLELAYNGNGVLEQASSTVAAVQPVELGSTLAQEEVPTTFHRPSGSGASIWPSTAPDRSAWTLANLNTDPLFLNTRNRFLPDNFHMLSHTFTHLPLNNITTYDTHMELLMNYIISGPDYMNLTAHPNYSNFSMVTPAISGMYNGDALKEINDFGIKSIVGDNSRVDLINPVSHHLPLITNASYNGYDGMLVIPREATDIYYCSSTVSDLVAQYNFIYVTTLKLLSVSTMTDILDRNIDRAVRNFMSLHRDPYMFHQPNLRVVDLPSSGNTYTYNGRTRKLGLLQLWTEAVLQAYLAIANWPLRAIKQDDQANMYRARQKYYYCNANTFLNVGDDGYIASLSATVGSASGCEVPISAPPGVSFLTAGTTNLVLDKLASEPVVARLSFANNNVQMTPIQFDTPVYWYAGPGVSTPAAPSPSTTPPAASPSSTPSTTPSATPSATPSSSKKPSASPTPTKKASASPTPTKKASASPTPTKKPSATPTPTKKPSATPTPTKKPSATPTPTKKA